MTYPHKTCRYDMKQEPAKELFTCERKDFMFVLIASVLIRKNNVVVGDLFDPVIAYCNTADILSKIFDHLPGSAE